MHLMVCLVFLVRSLPEKVFALLYMVAFFCDQSDVDEFVDNGSCGQKELFKVSLSSILTRLYCLFVVVFAQECNNFLAGNMLRSAIRFRALDETALFGSACCHEFPAVFLNLKHEERYIIITVLL